jgi:ATP-dependent helicase C-terminal
LANLENKTVLFGAQDDHEVPLVVELLSPAHRPVQVTRDLPGFWRGSYGAVKAEMKGRYPRHPWPDNHSPPCRRAAPSRARLNAQLWKRDFGSLYLLTDQRIVILFARPATARRLVRQSNPPLSVTRVTAGTLPSGTRNSVRPAFRGLPGCFS